MTVEERIAASFHKLVLTKEPDRVTVREIAEDAGVIRATFYNHFKDKSELLRYILECDLIEPVLGLFQNRMYEEATILIFRRFKEKEDFYMRASMMTKPMNFFDVLVECIDRLVHRHLKGRDMVYFFEQWVTTDIIADFYAHTVAFLAYRWIKGGMTISPEKIGSWLAYVGTHPLWEILEMEKGDVPASGDNREETKS